MGHQFVMGRTISEALARSHKGDNASYRYSFDMLGEGALTMKDALRYLENQAAQPFEVVFLDPPVLQSLLQTSCELLEDRRRRAERAWVYAESEGAPPGACTARRAPARCMTRSGSAASGP